LTGVGQGSPVQGGGVDVAAGLGRVEMVADVLKTAGEAVVNRL
jgi:hypothetical protein